MPTCVLSGPTAEYLGVSDDGFIPSAALVLMTVILATCMCLSVYIYICKYIDIYVFPHSRGN